MRKFLLCALFGLVLAAPAIAAEPCNSPKPDFLVMTEPTDDIPKNIREFAGHWTGMWQQGKKGVLCHNLYVTEVKPDGTVKAYYSWGRYDPWGINAPGYRKATGKIEGNKLNLDVDSGYASAVYTRKGNKLKGIYLPDSYKTPGTFTRIPSDKKEAAVTP
ncbi:MAG TPA: hypothetical protein VD928_03350 [Candidatus Paceibacterota bacterium]|nr:hypothetical protein [Candidatus Paceibacterota bacterium]